MIEGLLLANALSTWFMVGVIWLVQLVVYPSFRSIDPARFREAMVEHQRCTGRVVILPMLVELLASLLLLYFRFDSILDWLGMVCVGVWGFSTVLVQVPIHTRLAQYGPDIAGIDRLVLLNWPRTAAWTVHGFLCAVSISP